MEKRAVDGTLTVIDSTISGNTAGQSGGGIENRYASLAVTGSTISDWAPVTG